MKKTWIVVATLATVTTLHPAWSDEPEAPAKTDNPTAEDVATARAEAAQAKADAAQAKADLARIQAERNGVKMEPLQATAATPELAKPVLASAELPEGTKIRLQLTQDISSNKSRPGDEVRYCVADDVVGPNKQVLVKKGARATGTITEAKGARGLGRGGKLGFTVANLIAVDGTQVPLRGSQQSAGKSTKGSMVAVSLLLTPLGLFMRGHNMTIKQGTVIDAWVDVKTEIRIENTPALSPALEPVADSVNNAVKVREAKK